VKEERREEGKREIEKEREAQIYTDVHSCITHTHTRARPTSANLVFARLILRV